MRFIGVAAGPPVYSYFMTISEHTIYYISGAVSFLAAVIVMLFIKTKKDWKNRSEKKRAPRLA